MSPACGFAVAAALIGLGLGSIGVALGLLARQSAREARALLEKQLSELARKQQW